MAEDTRTPQTWEVCNWSRGGEVIDSRNVAQRLDDMADEHVDEEGEALPFDQWTADARQEAEALRELLKDIGDNLSNGFDLSANGDAMLIVRHDHLTAYVESHYGDTYGGDLHTENRFGEHVRLSWSDVMEREPFCWINWETVADKWRDRCAEITYYGVTYYLDH